MKSNLPIRPLQENNLAEADRIFRLAFGTLHGLPDPLQFAGDASYIRTRWLTDPTAAFEAELDGILVGTNFATIWGNFGFFGPLTIHPDHWGQGIGKKLMEPVMTLFATRGVRHMGLFTSAESPKHIGLYQKFGFWPRFLTAIMAKPVEFPATVPPWSKFSEVPPSEHSACLEACRDLTNSIFEGLDLTREINAVGTQKLGDTILLWDDSQLAGLAVCHCGPGTEAGSGTCFVKFGAVRPEPSAEERFDQLLLICEAFAFTNGLAGLMAGVNLGRHNAYRKMLDRGFRTVIQGVSMQRPNEAGYNRPEVFVVDDWR
jgi:GNAT superfamily N-acetyltransferase